MSPSFKVLSKGRSAAIISFSKISNVSISVSIALRISTTTLTNIYYQIISLNVHNLCKVSGRNHSNTFDRNEDAGRERHHLGCTSCWWLLRKELFIHLIYHIKIISRYHKDCSFYNIQKGRATIL